MIWQLINARRRKILIDLNTQKDFFLGGANVCVRNHRRVLANIRRMVAWARVGHVPLISVCQVYPGDHAVSDVNYCIDGTEGQKKIPYTLLSNRISFPADGSSDLPGDILRNYNQIILHKRSVNPFEEPRIDRLLSEIRIAEFILIGAAAEGAIEAMALGLLQRDKTVTVVTDAVGSRNKSEANLALRKIEAKGAKLIETKKIAGSSHLKYVGVCNCRMCQKKYKPAPVVAGSNLEI